MGFIPPKKRNTGANPPKRLPKHKRPVQLKHPAITLESGKAVSVADGNSPFSYVMLVDAAIPNSTQFVAAINTYTFPITYSTNSTKVECTTVLNNFGVIDRLAIAFVSNNSKPKRFLDRRLMTSAENVAWLIDIIKQHGIKNIDFLACDTLQYQVWRDFYQLLADQTGVIVGASNDRTGNVIYGGDWVLENTGEEIETVYFTQQIGYYKFLFDPIPTLPAWATTGDYPLGIAIDNSYVYVANNNPDLSGNFWITKISLTNPAVDIDQNWAQTGEYPTGLALYGGFLYVANNNDWTIGKIQLSDPGELNEQDWFELPENAYPYGLTIAGTNLYVSNNGLSTIGQISLIDPSGNNDMEWATIHVDGCPNYLTSYNGYLYVSDDCYDTVSKISLTNPLGDQYQSWLDLGEVSSPLGLTVYKNYLYVSLPYVGDNGTIGKFSFANPTTDYTYEWANVSSYSEGIAAHAPFMYVANSDNNSVDRTLFPATPVSTVCFPGDTPIKVDQEPRTIAISQIDPHRHTINGQVIRAITQTMTIDRTLVCFEPNALGRGMPYAKTIMSREHRVYWAGRWTQAEKLLGTTPKVHTVPHHGEILYNVLLNQAGTVLVNGLVCETLDPKNPIAQLYQAGVTSDQQYLLVKGLNEHAFRQNKRDNNARKQKRIRM